MSGHKTSLKVLLHFGDKSNSYGVTPQEAIETLQGICNSKCDFSYTEGDAEKFLEEEIGDAHILIGASATLNDRVAGLLRHARNLKLIQSIGTGVENFPLEAVKASGIYLANVRGANSVAVAEHAFALMLALAKRVNEKDRELKEGRWVRGTTSVQLEGKTIAVLGLGQIGSALARRALAFDMRVIALRKHVNRSTDLPIEVKGMENLKDVIRFADFVAITLPLTVGTTDLIGYDELKAMKSSAFLVNVGRGQVVNESALYEALTSGWIAGAGLDVWYALRDPPSRLGIHKLPNVVATPLIGSTTRESLQRIFEIVAMNIDAVAAGSVPQRLVNLEDGY